MGLRFRKSFPLGGLFRVNLSKSGVSLGIGPRGLNVNIGPRGVRRTVGLPGTGLFYQDNQSWKQVATDTPETVTPANAAGGVSWLKVLIGLVAIVLVVKACDTMTSSTDRSTSTSVNATRSSPSASQSALSADQSKPKDQSLNRDEMKELQSLLARSGYAPGPIDGKLGPRTSAAVQAFRKHSGDAATGDPTLATLVRLRAAKH